MPNNTGYDFFIQASELIAVVVNKIRDHPDYKDDDRAIADILRLHASHLEHRDESYKEEE